VLVLPPVLPEPAWGHEWDNRTVARPADGSVDLYVLGAYVNAPGFQRFLRQSGIPFEEAWIDMGDQIVALFVRDGIVTEGSSANFFAVTGKTLRTHPEGPYILSGITRPPRVALG
jgi:hypothetical protein